MAVRAKMRVTALRQFTDGGYDDKLKGVEVAMQPVYGATQDDKANAEWSKWTPSGELRLHITNPDAFRQFELGKTYYVDLTPTE